MAFDVIADALEDELPHLRRFARSLTRDPDWAEDLVGECLLKALERNDRFEPGTHLRRWLFTIMRNLAIDAHRKGQRRGVHLSVDDMQDSLSRPPSQEDHMRLREVEVMIGDLEVNQREVLALSVVSSLDHAGIADRLGVAVGTVKSRLSRARARLAE